MPESVQSQVTDAVTQTSSHVLGLGPASASINAYLSQSQSLSILFANMVNQQQQHATVALANTTQNVRKLLALNPPHSNNPASSNQLASILEALSSNKGAAGSSPHEIKLMVS